MNKSALKLNLLQSLQNNSCANRTSFTPTSRLITPRTKHKVDLILLKYEKIFGEGTPIDAQFIVETILKNSRTKNIGYAKKILLQLILRKKLSQPTYINPLLLDPNLMKNIAEKYKKIALNPEQQFYDRITNQMVDLNSTLQKPLNPTQHINYNCLRLMYIISNIVLSVQIPCKQKDSELFLLIILLYESGWRVGEILSLKIQEILILIQEGTIKRLSKMGMRTCYLAERSRWILKEYLNKFSMTNSKESHLFNNYNETNIKTNTAYNHFRYKFSNFYLWLFNEKVPIGSGVHDFRRYFAFRNSKNIKNVACALGHSHNMSKKYASVYQRRENPFNELMK